MRAVGVSLCSVLGPAGTRTRIVTTVSPSGIGVPRVTRRPSESADAEQLKRRRLAGRMDVALEHHEPAGCGGRDDGGDPDPGGGLCGAAAGELRDAREQRQPERRGERMQPPASRRMSRWWARQASQDLT